VILGISISTFTTIHVIISLLGIATGFVALSALIQPIWLNRLMIAFFAFTIATSVTGFMFHSEKFGPPHVIGTISLIFLAAALFALYGKHLAGFWRLIFILGAVTAQYLNVFVAIVQSFQKIRFLARLAPTQTEHPFLIIQIVVILLFAVLGFMVAKNFPRSPTAHV